MIGTRALLRVGLTGGIASGKTTVAGILSELGAFVLDADELARTVMQPGRPAHDSLVARFGAMILDTDGCIDRSRLAALVFHDDGARAEINRIVHPDVLTEAERRIAGYTEQRHARIAVFEAALLVETGLHREFHRLVVARCGRETQMRRLLVRDGLSAEEAEARIASQAPLENKLAVADYVVDTEGTLRETRKQIEGVYASLLTDFEREFP